MICRTNTVLRNDVSKSLNRLLKDVKASHMRIIRYHRYYFILNLETSSHSIAGEAATKNRSEVQATHVFEPVTEELAHHD